MNALFACDRELFALVNGQWSSTFFDWLMPAITDLHKSPIAVWAALPLALAFWAWRGRMRAIKSIIALALAMAASDLVSYRAVKPLLDRPRPEAAGVPVVLRVRSQGGPSFPSNHAANMFAAATLLWLALRRWSWIAFIYAFAVAYSRVYVGVHFPLDVLGGAAIGSLCGLGSWLALRRWIASPTKLGHLRKDRRSP
jgi:undecaprenyl-diphosphatase